MVDELLNFQAVLDASIHSTCNVGASQYLFVSELTHLPVACHQRCMWIALRVSGRPTGAESSQLTCSPVERNKNQPFLSERLYLPDSPDHELNLKGRLTFWHRSFTFKF
jgi:hypothetical protein